MTTSLKLLLAASVVAFLASLTDAGSALAWGVLKPVSAILFLVFFIGQLLHKEVVAYDEEFNLRMARAEKLSPASPVPKLAATTPSASRSAAPGTAAAH
jgi:hypothetical protein